MRPSKIRRMEKMPLESKYNERTSGEITGTWGEATFRKGAE